MVSIAQRRQRAQHPPRQQRPQHQPGVRQPAGTGAAASPTVRPPANIAAPWLGVDRDGFPTTPAKVAAPGWMGLFIDNSNMRFAGGYVTGAALSGSPAADFTNSSKAVARGWMAQWATLVGQGWGTALFYVGYSVGGGEPAPANVDLARGTLHGLHLRSILTALGPGFAGAVVFIDNEDTAGTALTQGLIDYYTGLFVEMSRPDPGMFAFRPGLYGHGLSMTTMLLARKDLFLWDVWFETATTTTPQPPFDPAIDPLTVDRSTRELKAYVASPPGGQPFVAWSLGRQFRSYVGPVPARGSAVARRVPGWWTQNTFDFDAAFGRDPSFPEGEPRLAVVSRAGAAMAAARRFVPRVAGPPVVPPQAELSLLSMAGGSVVPLASAVTLEPDAPSTLFARGPDVLLVTFLSGGGLGEGILNAASVWAPIDQIAGTVPSLRRVRVLAGVSRLLTESTLFSIAADDTLWVKRRQGTSAWEDAVAVGRDYLHPFSRLAVTVRGTFSIDTFFIDRAGLLTTSYWNQGMAATWPAFSFQRLENAPSFLPGGTLAAVSPRTDDVVVVGVGNDLRLRFAYWVNGTGWSTPASVGQPQDLVGAHTRMAAQVLDDSNVEIAVLTDGGALATYRFQRTAAGVWAAQPRTVIADPPPLAGAPPAVSAGAVTGPATGFRINPFGDIGLFRAPGATTSLVYCAGTRSGAPHALVRDLNPAASWQYFV